MQDVQSSPASVRMPIDRVGIKQLKLPLVVSDKQNGRQHTTAMVDIGVDLPADFKGTHMSRFVEALENWDDELNYQGLKTLLTDIKKRLDAYKAYVSFKFTYFIRKKSPVSDSSGLMGYNCVLTGELEAENPVFTLALQVPVMTVCPCSKAISREGAHSQRAMVSLRLVMRKFAWIEEFIDIVEASASCAVYPLLKREDEKWVTETAFANPCFVEDVVRNIAAKLCEHSQLSYYKVEVESFESIHDHNAFACIEGHVTSA